MDVQGLERTRPIRHRSSSHIEHSKQVDTNKSNRETVCCAGRLNQNIGLKVTLTKAVLEEGSTKQHQGEHAGLLIPQRRFAPAKLCFSRTILCLECQLYRAPVHVGRWVGRSKVYHDAARTPTNSHRHSLVRVPDSIVSSSCLPYPQCLWCIDDQDDSSERTSRPITATRWLVRWKYPLRFEVLDPSIYWTTLIMLVVPHSFSIILREFGYPYRYAVSSDIIPEDYCSCISFLIPTVLYLPWLDTSTPSMLALASRHHRIGGPWIDRFG